MKTLYLLGAGASAETVPTIQDMKEYFHDIYNLTYKNAPLSQGIPEKLLSDLELLHKGIVNFGTPDIFAKKCLLSNNFKEYLQTKRALSYYLMIWHIYSGIDKRYYAFLTALLNREDSKVTLHPDVMVATWNYDLQYPSALSALTGKTVEQLNTEFDKIYHDYDNDSSFPKSFFRLNGYAGSYLLNQNSSKASILGEDYSFLYTQEDSEARLTSLIELYNHLLDKNDKITYNICYAWDDKEKYHPSKEDLFTSVSEIEVLVVIGYSFPNFNRNIDKKLVLSMPKLKKVYLQDKVNYLKHRVYPIAQTRNLEILDSDYISDIDQFYIPNEIGDF